MTVKKIKTIYSKLEQIQSDLNNIRDTYSDSFDRKSAKWQGSEKGEMLASRISWLESALTDLDGVLSNLDEASYEED
jgi:hypothetical protein